MHAPYTMNDGKTGARWTVGLMGGLVSEMKECVDQWMARWLMGRWLNGASVNNKWVDGWRDRCTHGQ